MGSWWHSMTSVSSGLSTYIGVGLVGTELLHIEMRFTVTMQARVGQACCESRVRIRSGARAAQRVQSL